MKNFELDFGLVNNVVNPDTSRVPYKGNEKHFVRIAFDCFKLKDNACEDLWQVQADDDGNEYLVRTYDASDDDKQITASDWSVSLDKTASNLTISYKSTPIHRLAATDYGVTSENDALLLRDVVVEKLATSKEFFVKFASELPKEKLEILAEMGAIDPVERVVSPEDMDEDRGPGFEFDDFVKVEKMSIENVLYGLNRVFDRVKGKLSPELNNEVAGYLNKALVALEEGE